MTQREHPKTPANYIWKPLVFTFKGTKMWSGTPGWAKKLWSNVLNTKLYWKEPNDVYDEYPVFIPEINNFIEKWSKSYISKETKYRRALEALYDKFIKNGAKYQINVNGDVKKFKQANWMQNGQLVHPADVWLTCQKEMAGILKGNFMKIHTDPNFVEWKKNNWNSFLDFYYKKFRPWLTQMTNAMNQRKQGTTNAMLGDYNQYEDGYYFDILPDEVEHGHGYYDDGVLDVYYNEPIYYDYNKHDQYANNGDLMMIGTGIMSGLVLMAVACCICLIISFLCGGFAYKWMNKHSSKEKRAKQYQSVNNDEIEHI